MHNREKKKNIILTLSCVSKPAAIGDKKLAVI